MVDWADKQTLTDHDDKSHMFYKFQAYLVEWSDLTLLGMSIIIEVAVGSYRQR